MTIQTDLDHELKHSKTVETGTDPRVDNLHQKFQQLLESLTQSLRKGRNTLKHIVNYLLTMPIFSRNVHGPPKKYLLFDQDSTLSQSTNYDELYISIAKYWSVLDVEILQCIVGQFASKKNQKKIIKYKEEVVSCLKSLKLKHKCSINLGDPTRAAAAILYVILGAQNLSSYYTLKASIATAFEIHEYCLQCIQIELRVIGTKGYMQLQFLFPERAVEKVKKSLQVDSVRRSISESSPAILKVIIVKKGQMQVSGHYLDMTFTNVLYTVVIKFQYNYLLKNMQDQWRIQDFQVKKRGFQRQMCTKRAQNSEAMPSLINAMPVFIGKILTHTYNRVYS